MSNSLQPHGLECARLPCPSLSIGVCSNSCPLSLWYYSTILASITPFSCCPQSFPASGSFPVSQLFWYLVKAMVFPVVMYRSESWTIKKAEHERIDAFELWCWRRLLRVPWTARRSNQSILKEISPEISLEGLTLKLKIQYFGHMMWRTNSLEKTLMLGKI